MFVIPGRDGRKAELCISQWPDEEQARDYILRWWPIIAMTAAGWWSTVGLKSEDAEYATNCQVAASAWLDSARRAWEVKG